MTKFSDGVSKKEAVLLGVLTLLSGVLRFYRLGFHSLWFDEILTVSNANHRLFEIHKFVTASPPLFHYLIHFVLQLFGPNDFWLRAPSAVFGTIAIPILYFWLRSFYGKQTAFIVGLLSAVHPFAVAYSREVRMYSLVFVEALACNIFWQRGLLLNRTKDWALYAVSAIASLFTHNWFLFLVTSHAGICLLCYFRKFKMGHKALWAYLLVILSYIPWIPTLHAQMATDQFHYAVAPLWYHIQVTIEAFAGTRVPVGHAWIISPSDALRISLSTLALLLLGWGVLKKGKDQFQFKTFFLGSFILPLIIGLIVSMTGTAIYHGSRYTIIMLPAFFFMSARSMNQNDRRTKTLVQGLFLLWSILLMFSYPKYFSSDQKAPWKGAAAWIKQTRQPGDVVAITALDDYNRMCMEYYIKDISVADPRTMKINDGKNMFLPVRKDQASNVLSNLFPMWRAIDLFDQNNLVVFKLQQTGHI